MVENSGVRTLLIYLDKDMGDFWHLVPIGLGRVTSTYKVRNSNYDWFSVISSVPQGSVMGPVLKCWDKS